METTTHTPIVVPCEELQVILDHIENTGPMSTTTAEAVERIRGRFPAEWPDCHWCEGPHDEERHQQARMEAECEFEHPHPSHPCGKRTPNNYETNVPEALRRDVEAKLQRWADEGRPSTSADNLIGSLVLEAYKWGRRDAAAAAVQAVEEVNYHELTGGWPPSFTDKAREHVRKNWVG